MMAHIAASAIQDTYVLAAQAPIRAMTWARLQEAASQCPSYQELLTLVRSGLPELIADWPDHLHPYHSYRYSLLIMVDLILCGERPLVPLSLRPEAPDQLHAPTQATTPCPSAPQHQLLAPAPRAQAALPLRPAVEQPVEAAPPPSLPAAPCCHSSLALSPTRSSACSR